MAKQHYCFLKKFNNYFNRKIIKFESLTDYQNNSDDSYIPVDANGAMTPFDFNPNDNVTTEIIANDVPFEPDYFLLLDADENIVQRWFCIEQKRNRQGQWLYQLKRDVVSDNLDTLLTAPIFVEKGMLKEDDPFIVNSEGVSLNQIKKDELLILDRSNTAWIIGYMAKNIGGADVNIQVDTETLNIDYITLGDIAQAMGTTEGKLVPLLNMENDETNKSYFANSVIMNVTKEQIKSARNHYQNFKFTFSSDFSSGSGSLNWTDDEFNDYFFKQTEGTDNTFISVFIEGVKSIDSSLKNSFGGLFSRNYYFTNNQLSILSNFNGKYLKYNGSYYILNIKIKGSQNSSKTTLKNDGTYTSVGQISSAVLTEASSTAGITLIGGPYNPSEPRANILDGITVNETEVVIALSFVSVGDTIPQLNTTVSSGRKVTGDQEYDIFAIPLNIDVNDNGPDFETVESYAKRIASAIAREENAKVYDLQLLPYCPLPSLITSDGEIDITGLSEHTDFDYIFKNISEIYFVYKEKNDITFTPSGVGTWDASVTLNMVVPAGKTGTVVNITAGEYSSNISYTQAGNSVTVTFTYSGPDPTLPDSPNVIVDVYYTYPEDDVKCGVMFYLSTATFETTIQTSSLNPYWNYHFFESKKVLSNCSLLRLVSPNYQGAFEFNIAKNGGRIDSFNIFCTYKPYTPVIKVAPNFNWLYGYEFKDNRGLICGGDFSLPRLTDEWRTYELNNKNYQNIFNRDIQHLEFMQGIEMRNQLISGGVGIFSDAVKGGTAGAMVGGGYGAIAGAVIGAGASAVGYGVDVDTMARTHRENKQLAIDKFNYQLGNIKALPYTLTKVGSFDVISKIFPFIETYWCSDEELEAFKNKIKYESMTVMRIGTLQEFINFDSELHYFKGTLIRNDEIADDTHILNAIYEELLKGVYI